jgi:uncharacterized protein (DUF1499 family)
LRANALIRRTLRPGSFAVMLPRMTITAVVFAALAAVCLLLSGPGTRAGIWDFRVGLALFALAGLFGLVAAVTGAIAHTRTGTIAAAVGVAALLLPAYGAISARRVPPIHDITTDLTDPPRFSAVLAARGSRSNPINDPMDPDVVRQHRAGYPDLQPLILPLAPDAAFARIVKTAGGSGWTIVAADPAQRVLEATATTSFFGFRDDIAVRVRPADAGSRIDVRSTSRVGLSDAGANAARIRKFFEALQQD